METPETFPFPFPPYDIQKDFMKSLFRTLEDGKFGIFESPTGTGKSLSLICGTLYWFQKHEERRRELLRKQLSSSVIENDDDEESDWFEAAKRKIKAKEEKFEYKKELTALENKDNRIKALKQKRNEILSKDDVNSSDFNPYDNGDGDDDDELILKEYLSDEDEDGNDDEEDEDNDYSLRIYYCSRTHSQLSQFVKEVQKSPFEVRLVSLASRANLCINDSVRKLNHNILINERCQELQSKKKGKKTNVEGSKKQKCSSGCPFNKQSNINALQKQSLFNIMDIEDLVNAGRKLKACPYYASRSGVEDAEIIVLPYNTLLHKPTRETIGIKLKNSVVIIDEAHNLLETISHIHSSEITLEHLTLAKSQLSQYLAKYKSRLMPKNILYIKQLIFVINNFIKLDSPGCSRMITVFEFMNEAEIFNLNIFKLIRYVIKSNISRKIHGLSKKYEENPPPQPKKGGVTSFLHSMLPNKNEKEAEKEEASKPSSSSPLLAILEFLQNLTNVIDAEGRVLLTRKETFTIKYLLLTPSTHFKELLTQCRSVIVAGGTMQPVSEFEDLLQLSKDKVNHFSCGHVIPDGNLLPLVLQSGPSGRTLDFSYEFRDTNETLSELCRALLNLANIIPGGIVVFFPSYDYENKVFSFLEKNGILAKLSNRKRVLREPRKTDQMDKVLKEYGRAISDNKGALLLSVVGGKMSEGINFSDDLGRAVVMVGLPFPNSKSPELKEKMQFLKMHVGPNAGRAHYENLCMKAVNQSIGRAIRHKNDYATILLLDHRYARTNIKNQLPGWIKQHLQVVNEFGPSLPIIKKFFVGKK